MKTLRTLSAFIVISLAASATCLGAQAQAEPQAKEAGDCTDTAPLVGKLDRQEKLLNDWPNLSHYRDANAKIAPPAKNETRVVFMGDSITDMWVNPEFGGFFPGRPYIDRGISGQTTPQMLIRFRPDVISLRPRIVVILAGTNDIAGNTGPMTLEEIEGNLASMAELARTNGIRVVLATVLPVSDYGHDREGKSPVMTDGRPPEKILALNNWSRKYAAEKGHVYLDYFASMADERGFLKRELSEDGLHPNAAGYAIMSTHAETAINAASKNRN